MTTTTNRHHKNDTGLVDRVDVTSWEVHPGVASRPVPTFTMQGTGAVITGLRFSHSTRCVHCRGLVYLYSDGGTIQCGLETVRRGRTVRWYRVEKPGCRPALPTECLNPGCGNTDRPYITEGAPSVVANDGQDLVNRMYGTVRETHPDLAAQADTADMRYQPATR